MDIKKIKDAWFSNPRADFLSGITVAFALIPEAIAFSVLCGVNPMVGLYASFCIAIILSFTGGRPAMISAATGAMALVMVTLVKKYGIEYMFAATILAGVIQFILGKLGFGKFIRFVPHPVIIGFVNALAILIFMAQVEHFTDVTWITYPVILITLAIIYLFPKITKKIPSSLVAILFMTIVSIVFKLDVVRVINMGDITNTLPSFHAPDIMLSLGTLKIILPYAATLAFVGILESLLTATIVDDMTDTTSDKNKEVVGQGLGNIVAGFFGGMAGCAMIGQSIINIKSGGRGRLSTLTAGSILMILIIFFGDFVKQIPMGVLAAVMIMVSISTFEWSSLKEITKTPPSCAFVMSLTVVVIVWSHNLAYGVIAGILLSAVIFAWKITVLHIDETIAVHNEIESKVYKINGQLFFASADLFVESFKYSNDKEKSIVIDFNGSHIWDHSAINAISRVKEKYVRIGKKVNIVGLNDESSNAISKLNKKLITDY